jgi:NET1-associated nuclear protein 1 (U3 small nucleolar RNA-associated protein 17)
VSIDGVVMIWDYRDGVMLMVIGFGQPISGLHFRPGEGVGGCQVCLLVTRKLDSRDKEREKESISAVCVDWEVVSGRGGQTTHLSPSDVLSQSPSLLYNLSKDCHVAFTHQGSCLVGFSRKDLLVYSFDQDATLRHSQRYKITCVAAHPSKDCIATGNKHGQVLLWYEFLDPTSSPVCTTLHWHAHSVHDIEFTSEGTNLLSVGVEGVLVMWRVESKKCNFRPHLGGPIRSVSTSFKGDYFALGMQDNTVKIMSASTNEVEATLGGLIKAYLDSGQKNGVFTSLVRDPLTESIVLNATLGHLQFYHPSRRELSREFNVTNLNYVSHADDKPLIPTVVKFVAFSENGDWMSTVESRNDGKTAPELRMKFWKRKQENQSFELNTLVDPPHYSPITGMAFQPGHSSEMCVTTCEDGCFKTWSLFTGKKQDHHWYCRTESYYLREPTIGCVFCEDGSIVAVVYEKYITLWQPEMSTLKKVFTVPSPSEAFRQSCFQVVGSNHYLLSTTTQQLCVWDLRTCAVTWSVRADVECIVCSQFSPHVAAFVRKNGSLNVCLFSADDPTPIAVFEDVCSHSILGAVFLKTPSPVSAREEVSEEDQPHSATGNWFDSCSLYFLSHAQSMYRIGRVQEEERKLNLKYHGDEEQTVYQQIFGLHSDEVKVYTRAEPLDRPTGPNSKLLKIFSGPPHTLPPISMLCSVFLKSINSQNPLHSSSEHDISVDDEEMEFDEKESKTSENDESEMEEDKVEKPQDSHENVVTTNTVSTKRGREHDILVEQDIGDFSWLTDTFKMK